MTEIAQTEKKLSRRSLLGGAMTLGSGAALSAAVAPVALAAPAVTTHDEKLPTLVASASKNIVETESGKVYGYSSEGVIAYRGIPYGASTAGANRFKPAIKPKPWTGVRSALHWGWVAPQVFTNTWDERRAGWTHDDESFMFQWEDGQPSEDCLSVNVWTPGLDNKKRPVMFWIHGGGYTSGCSHELASYDGQNLARRGDVVVVSVNHRLGPLGFLNLSEYGDQYAHSGNVGVLDLVAALDWVRTNIGNFGGDPGTVMIFGQSGGGGKVSTLMGMPAARGLFHRAAIQSSGTPIRQVAEEASLRNTAALLKELGIDKSNIEKIHAIPTEDIFAAAVRVSRQTVIAGSPQPGMGSWGPVVEGHDLPRHSWDPRAPEPSATVPLLTGTALNEFGNSIQMGKASYEDMTMDEVKARFEKQYPGKADALIGAISKAHTIRKPFDLFAISGGLPRRVSVLTMASLKAEQGKAPAFVYKFNWQSPMCDGRARAYHTGELPFVFYNTQRCASLTGGGPGPMPLAGRVADAWINFARKGDPNHAGLPKWDPFSKDTKPTMVLDTQCELKRNLDDAEVEAAKGFVNI